MAPKTEGLGSLGEVWGGPWGGIQSRGSLSGGLWVLGSPLDPPKMSPLPAGFVPAARASSRGCRCPPSAAAAGCALTAEVSFGLSALLLFFPVLLLFLSVLLLVLLFLPPPSAPSELSLFHPFPHFPTLLVLYSLGFSLSVIVIIPHNCFNPIVTVLLL